MTEPVSAYTLVDRGDRRLLTVDGHEHTTAYSERVLRMLIERKGARRAALYLPFKETRGRHFLGPLFGHLRASGARELAVLEVGCSFGHMTEYLDEQREVGAITTFDTDPAFAAMARAKVEEMGLKKVREVALFGNAETRRLPYATGAFDLVVVCGVIEHLPDRHRRAQVDEYYRVLAAGGHIAILDTPNRAFPLETHSVGLPLVQWLPPRLAHRYARLARPIKFRDSLLRRLHGRRHRLAQRLAQRLPPVIRQRRARRPDRDNGLRLALLPNHGPLTHPPRTPPIVRRSHSSAPRSRPTTVLMPPVLQPAVSEAVDRKREPRHNDRRDCS